MNLTTGYPYSLLMKELLLLEFRRAERSRSISNAQRDAIAVGQKGNF